MEKISKFKYVEKFIKLLTSKYFLPSVILVAVLSRLATWFFPYDSDQWIYYYVGNNWFHQGTLYITAWDHKAPVIYAINGFMSLMFGSNLLLHRLFFTVTAALTVWLFYLTSKRFLKYINSDHIELGSKIGTLLFAFWLNLSQFTNSGNDTENFATLFVILALYSYLKSTSNKPYKNLLLSGLSMSLLAYFKINFLILILPIVIDILRIHLKDIKVIILKGLALATPTTLMTIFWLYYFNKIGTFHEFIIAAFSFNQKYFSMGWSESLHNKLSFITVIFVALLFFAPFIYKAFKDTKFKKNESLLINILIFTLIFSLMMSPYYNHYYLIVLPYLCLIVSKYFKYVFNSKILLTITAVGLIGSYAISTKQLYNNFRGSDHVAFIQLNNAAKYVDANSNLNDKVIFYGYGATFYQVSNRQSGSRYVSASHPYMDYINNFGFGITDTFIKDMIETKPKFIVISNADNYLYSKVLPVENYFNTNYHEATKLPGYNILQKN